MSYLTLACTYVYIFYHYVPASMSDIRSKKSCAATPSCTVHKCRPRASPCPDPQKCYNNSRKSPVKCESAKEIITARGANCTCNSEHTKFTRRHKDRKTCCKKHRTFKERVKQAYAKRSTVSRWSDPKRKKCVIL